MLLTSIGAVDGNENAEAKTRMCESKERHLPDVWTFSYDGIQLYQSFNVKVNTPQAAIHNSTQHYNKLVADWDGILALPSVTHTPVKD